MTVDELDRLAAEKAVKRLIETKVIKASYGSCWLWTGYVGWHGYGQYRLKNKSYKIHRLFYETFVAPLIPGMQIDHLCKMRTCVNPSHLEQVTARENTFRSETAATLNARKTKCLRGHDFDSKNKKGARTCKACSRLRYKKHYVKNKEKIIRRQLEKYNNEKAITKASLKAVGCEID